MEEKRIVSINMFGGFSVSCEGMPVALDYANTTKMMQLLISVLAAGKEGIPRKSSSAGFMEMMNWKIRL